jgi:predicted DNA-binding transcriptional regulator YafY
MTISEFDAPASASRFHQRALPGTHRSPSERPVIRLAWLITRLVRRDPVSFAHYLYRFGHSLRTFRRDMAVLRDAGLYLDTDLRGAYELICFRPDPEAR